jgi:hypothetical protein
MNQPKKLSFNLRGVALGLGLGAALTVSNGPAVGIALGAALALVFGLSFRNRQPGC